MRKFGEGWQRVNAIFWRYGTKHADHSGETALLLDVRDKAGECLADHVWVRARAFKAARVRMGDVVSFRAVSAPYVKTSGQVDWALLHPSKIRIKNPV
jgi:hypothetical protein